MQIMLTGRGIELTPAIEDYVNKKIGALDKFFAGIVRSGVVVGMETHHHQKGDIFMAEAKLEIPGNDVFVKETAGSLYAAIDNVRDRLEHELKKRKVKMSADTSKKKEQVRNSKEYSVEEAEA